MAGTREGVIRHEGIWKIFGDGKPGFAVDTMHIIAVDKLKADGAAPTKDSNVSSMPPSRWLSPSGDGTTVKVGDRASGSPAWGHPAARASGFARRDRLCDSAGLS